MVLRYLIYVLVTVLLKQVSLNIFQQNKVICPYNYFNIDLTFFVKMDDWFNLFKVVLDIEDETLLLLPNITNWILTFIPIILLTTVLQHYIIIKEYYVVVSFKILISVYLITNDYLDHWVFYVFFHNFTIFLNNYSIDKNLKHTL